MKFIDMLEGGSVQFHHEAFTFKMCKEIALISVVVTVVHKFLLILALQFILTTESISKWQ